MLSPVSYPVVPVHLVLALTFGFLLSLVDGNTTVREIVSISGMDAFDAFRIMKGLLETKIAAVDN